MRIAFVGPTYQVDSKPTSVQQTVNMYPVPIEPGNERTAWVFKDMPGLVEATTFESPDTTLFLFHMTNTTSDEGVSEFTDFYGATDQTGATWDDNNTQWALVSSSPTPKFGALALGADAAGSATWLRDAVQVSPVPSTVPIGANTALTIDAWAYRATGSSGGFQVRVGAAYPDYFVLNLSEFGTQAQMWGAAVYLNAAVIAADQWVHVRLTYDSDILRLFVGGVLAASSASTPGLLATIDPIETMQITVENFGSGGFLGDEVTAFLGVSASTTDFTPPIAPWPNP